MRIRKLRFEREFTENKRGRATRKSFTPIPDATKQDKAVLAAYSDITPAINAHPFIIIRKRGHAHVYNVSAS